MLLELNLIIKTIFHILLKPNTFFNQLKNIKNTGNKKTVKIRVTKRFLEIFSQVFEIILFIISKLLKHTN